MDCSVVNYSNKITLKYQIPDLIEISLELLFYMLYMEKDMFEALPDYCELRALTHFGRYHFSRLKSDWGEQVLFATCGKVDCHNGAFLARFTVTVAQENQYLSHCGLLQGISPAKVTGFIPWLPISGSTCLSLWLQSLWTLPRELKGGGAVCHKRQTGALKP